LRVASEVAGFDLVKADLLRQAIAKKKVDVMASLRKDFVEGCVQHSKMDREIAEGEFDKIYAASRYGFNKCISGHETLFTDPRQPQHGLTIHDMYRVKNDAAFARRGKRQHLHEEFNANGYGVGWSLGDNGRVQPNTIVDIRYMGVKHLFRIQMEDERTIDVTDNHKFPTVFGEKRVYQLKAGDVLYCQNKIQKKRSNSIANLVPIKSIKHIGTSEVYDVEMSQDVSHTFMIANGIITSNSHAASYAYNAYIDLYFRYHHPVLFYATSLAYEMFTGGKKETKNENVKRLIQAAKARGIKVVPPSLNRRNLHTDFDKGGDTIHMGFNCIKGLGLSTLNAMFKRITSAEKRHGNILEQDWMSVLTKFYSQYKTKKNAKTGKEEKTVESIIGKAAMEIFASIGLFDKIDPNRSGLIFDVDVWNDLHSKKEGEWIIEQHKIKPFPSLRDALEAVVNAPLGKGGACSTQGRLAACRSLLALHNNRPSKTSDAWIMAKENTIMGVTMAQIRLVGANLERVNMSLDEIGPPATDCIVAVAIKEVRVMAHKSGRDEGKDYAVLQVVDENDTEASLWCFNNVYQKVIDYLYPGAQLICHGNVGDRGMFIVTNVEPVV